MVKVQVKDAKTPKPFFTGKSSAYGPIYFKYRQQSSNSTTGYACGALHCRLPCY